MKTDFIIPFFYFINELFHRQKPEAVRSIFFRVLVLTILLPVSLNAAETAHEQTDSVLSNIDSVQYIPDSSTLMRVKNLSESSSLVISDKDKKSISDFQLLRNSKNNIWVFAWVFCSLLILAFFKNFFRNEASEFFDKIVNFSGTNVLGRSSQQSVSALVFLLTAIFIVNSSVVASVFTLTFFNQCTLDLKSLTLIFIFLFTLFIAIKVFTVTVIGFVFDETEAASNYLHDFLMIIQTVGISIFPIVVVLMLVPKNDYIIVFYFTLFVLFLFAAVFVMRGLSTSLNLLYKSLYHFLLYICVQEILYVFLFIKLLTKIAF